MAKNSAADDLMGLLNSLTGAERRYFRIHASRWGHDDGPTMQLYDFLLEAGEWNEEAIGRAFEGMPILKQLNVARTRLQESVLHALRDFDNGRTYQLEFSRRLDEIDVLFRRKLYSVCHRVAKAAQRRAQSLELPLQELSVLSMLLRLERQRGSSEKGTMEGLHLRHSLVARQLSAEMELIAIHDSMLALLNQYGRNPSLSRAEAEALLLTPVMVTGVSGLAFDAKVLYWHVMAYHALILADYSAYHRHYQQLVEVWENLPDRMRLEEERAFKTFASYAESAALADRIDQMPKAIEKLKRILANSSVLKAVEHARIVNLELEYLIKVGENQEAAELAIKAKASLQAYSAMLPASLRLGLISNSLVACFLTGQWALVLDWVQRLHQEIGPMSGEQLHGLASVSQWIALYELLRHEELERVLRAYTKSARSAEASSVAQCMSALLDCEDEVQERRVIQALLDTAIKQVASSGFAYFTLAVSWAQDRLTH